MPGGRYGKWAEALVVVRCVVGWALRVVMGAILGLIGMAVFWYFLGAWQQSKAQGRFAEAVEALPIAEGELTLYSLYPYDPVKGASGVEGGAYYGFRILGEKVISDAGEKQRLIAAFTKAIRKKLSEGSAACFNPRHGIRITKGKEVWDFVICFECERTRAYNFVGGVEFPVKRSGEGEFNDVLDRYGIDKAPGKAR